MSRFLCTYSGAYDADTVSLLCEGLRIQPLAARALIRRGLTKLEDAERFLHPDLLPLADPFDMEDMQRAVRRLQDAFAGNESICVYGDYDADGICATAILLDCFAKYTAHAFAYIPSRHDEGYGLHEGAVRALHERGVQLIVTVDNGVSAHREIRLCGELGMDVIVTDHHTKPSQLPACAAVVTPDDDACGAGVALRLARALSGDDGLNRWLPMAAVATVADIVPLEGDNRVLVARGLPLIEENLGLRALLRAAGGAEDAVNATTLAFLLAPRLNAAGRLGDAMRGVALLLAKDLHTADRLAAELNDANARRRVIEGEMLAEAEAMLEAFPQPGGQAVLLCHTDWNVGVIGIVASRLSEKRHCPTVLFREDENGILTGSGRSAGEINLYEALSACSQHFIRFGGHAGAAGITMRKACFESFCADFCAYLASHYDVEAFLPAQCYDETIPLGELTLSAVAELNLLAPFGEKNPEPVYRIRDLRLTELKRMGQGGRHISARACGQNASLRAVGFGWGERFEELRTGERWTLLARPSVHSYRGMESVELMISGVQNEEKLFDDFFMNVLYNSVCVEDLDFSGACAGKDLHFDDAAIRRLYTVLQNSMDADGCPINVLISRCGREEKCALLVFCELGFFIREGDWIRPAQSMEKRTLAESRIYRRLQSKDIREDASWT